MSDPFAKATVEMTARERVSSVESYQSVLRNRYRRLHHYAYPLNGDQWPEDIRTPGRQGKIHITANICKPLVEIDARLQALIPRIACKPNGIDPKARKAAEEAEKVVQTFLELSDWDIWLNLLTKTKCVYGKGILKPFWNTAEGRPDVTVIEEPGNLILGWGTSDFHVLDFAVYQYGVSAREARYRWPDMSVERYAKGGGTYGWRVTSKGDHADPAGQRDSLFGLGKFVDRDTGYVPSEYENDQLQVWDYWWLDEEGIVQNALLLEGTVVAGPFPHPELPFIPYIVIENEHEPGSPEGVATHEPVIDIQIELDRAYSHWAQLVADEIDPAWQLTGENADSVPPGMIPKSGQITPAGAGNRIEPLAKGVNTFPVQALTQELWGEVHRITGLPQVLFGTMPGAQTAGRALAVQVEAASNRLDPKRRLLYSGLRRLILAWVYMLEKKNPKITQTRLVPIEQDPNSPPSASPQMQTQTVTIGLGDVVRGFRRWSIIAPEITPRDAIESTTNTINQVQAKIISLDTARDQLGYDSPADEGEKVEQERQNINLFPGDVQTRVAVVAALQSIQAQQAQQQAQQAALAAANDQRGQAASTAAAQQGTPALSQGANEGPTQPMTQAGGPPPGGPAAPQATQQTLVRAEPGGGAKSLNQIAISQPIGGR